jgi:hypothetical protein
MTTSSSKSDFTGPYSTALTELAKTIDFITAEHGTSFVKAGDNKVYALGGNGYVVVLDENEWNGLIEVLTPKATIHIRPAEGGGFSVAAEKLEQSEINLLLTETSEKLRSYYEKRYWRTPKIA